MTATHGEVSPVDTYPTHFEPPKSPTRRLLFGPGLVRGGGVEREALGRLLGERPERVGGLPAHVAEHPQIEASPPRRTHGQQCDGLSHRRQWARVTSLRAASAVQSSAARRGTHPSPAPGRSSLASTGTVPPLVNSILSSKEPACRVRYLTRL